jgi:menaquinol-cytochrome c reductase iron-sulfur subunit
MAESHHVSRRDFIKIVAAAVGTFMGVTVGVPAIGYLISPALRKSSAATWIPLGKLSDFPIGTPTLVTFVRTTVNGWEQTANSFGAFVLRKSEDSVLVLSNKCTHLGCWVNWHADQAMYICPCHDGQFTITGNVVGGPPPRPMDQYTTKLENGSLFILFTEG